MVKFYDDNVIVATKGDTIRKPFYILDNNGILYMPNIGDVITAGVKEKYDDETCLITKVLDNDALEFVLEHDDTKNLEPSKIYVYDIQIKKDSNGDIMTFMEGKIKILPEVCDAD